MSPIRLLSGRLIFLSLLYLVPCCGPILAQDYSEPTSFVQAVLSRHPSLKKADELVQAAHFGLKASGLQANPTLTLAATVGDAGEDSNALVQTLEISGQPSLRRRIAESQLQATIQERDAVRKQVAGAAYRAWLAVWRTHRLLELAQLRNQLLKDTVRVAKRRFEVGEISENESLRVELAAVQAEVNLVQSQAALDSARQRASLLLGNASELLTASINPGEPSSLLPITDLANLMDSVPEHPAIKGRLSQLSALELGAELIGKERAPTLGFSLYRSKLISNTVEQGAQVALSWPIFDWGSIRHRKSQQQSEASAFRAGIDEVLLEFRSEVASAWNSLEAAKKNRDTLAEQAERYEELAREARIAYDVGLWSLTDVFQTEQSYRQAGVELLEARAEVWEIEVKLIELTGLDFPKDFFEEKL